MSPTSNVKNNCGVSSRKCKTFDDAVKVSLNDDDQTSVIILDGGTTERTIYRVRSYNITYNKNLLIKGDQNSKFYPVIETFGGISKDYYLFFIDGGNINFSIQSVQMENVAFVNVKSSGNLNLTVNDCYVKQTLGSYFINISQNDNPIDVRFKNSSFLGDLKSENRVMLVMGKDHGLIQFENCSFKDAYIEIQNSSYLRISNSVFINTVIHVFRANYLHIADSVFKNYFQTSVNYSSLEIYKSNASFENCFFFNNTNYRMFASESMLYLIKLYFYNNTCAKSTILIQANFSLVTFLKLEINSTNFYNNLIYTKGCKTKVIDSLFERNTVNYSIIQASNSELSTADDLKKRGNSLVILNTAISENYVKSIADGKIDGKFEISYCVIQNNTSSGKSRGKDYIGEIFFSKNQLNISHTTITFNSARRLIFSLGDLYVAHTRFTSNNVLLGIMAASVHLKLSEFEKNVMHGSLIYIKRLKWPKFFTDSSDIEGLTVSRNIIGKDVINTNSRSRDNSIQIEGFKAIHNSFRSCFAITGSFTNISNSTVLENKAHGLGKLVTFQSSRNTNSKTRLELKNVFSSFNLSDAETAFLYVNMISESLSLTNLTLDLSDTNGAATLPVIIFERNKMNPDIDLDINIECPYNYYPNSASDFFKSKFAYRLSCKSCARGLYSLNRGFTSLTGINLTEERRFYQVARYLISNISETKKPFKCYACPAGGICESIVRSRGNFYGYLSNNDMLQFIPCPEHYCCSKKGVECTSYNTCNSYRTGILCGACMKGYLISYFSNKCIPISQCTAVTRSLFWVSYIIVSIIFTIALCFAKDILVLFKKGLSFLKKKILRQKDKTKNIILELDQESCVLQPNNKQTQTNFPKEISYSAIFNVLVSFYQLRGLLQIPVDDKGNSSYISAVSDFFNLNIMLQTADKYCPTRDTDAVYRDFLKNFLRPICMISIILVSLNIKNIYRFIKEHIFRRTHQCERKSRWKYLLLKKRFYVGFYVVAAFSYQKVSTFALRLIHCVKINNAKVLYIAGDTKCYNTWQVLDMFFLAFWVIPFPASVSFAYHLLKKDKINVRVFMLCIMLPPATPLIFILTNYFHISVKARNCKQEEHIKNKFSERFEEPYRKKYFWWETWTLYERLIVGCLTTFLVDPVIRLFALTPALLLFLWIHIRAKPFKYTKSLLYQVDMASYICLCLNLVINILRAVVYIYSLPSQHPIDLVLRVSTYLEHLFTPVWVLIVRFFSSLIRMKSKKS